MDLHQLNPLKRTNCIRIHSTGTALSGMVNGFYKIEISTNIWQMRFQHLANEVRTSFVSESENRADRDANLKYLNALVQEGLRLLPPVLFGMSRVVLRGMVEVPGR